jgi:hypothetical protein
MNAQIDDSFSGLETKIKNAGSTTNIIDLM